MYYSDMVKLLKRALFLVAVCLISSVPASDQFAEARKTYTTNFDNRALRDLKGVIQGTDSNSIATTSISNDSNPDPLVFFECEFEKGFELSDLDLRFDLMFYKCKVRGDFRIENVSMPGSLQISGDSVSGLTSISVRGNLDRKGGVGLMISSSTFLDSVSLSGHLESLSCSDIQFNAPVEIDEMQIEDGAFFDRCKFQKRLSVGKIRSDKGIQFDHTEFSSTVLFGYCDSISHIYFDYVVLPETLGIMGWATGIPTVDLLTASPPVNSPKCKLAILPAIIDSMFIRFSNFELAFPKYSFLLTGRYGDTTTIEEEWSLDARAACFEKFLAKYRREGSIDSYREVDIQYTDCKYEFAGLFSRAVVGPFWRMWWMYGYEKWRVFIWTCICWLGFSIITMFKYRRLTEGVYCIEFLQVAGDLESGLKRKAKDALKCIVYTAFIFFGLKLSMDRFELGALRNHPWLFGYLMFIYVTGLLCLGFIANIIFT